MASRLQIDEDSDWTCLRLGERQYFWNDETDEKMLALTEGVKIREVDNLVQTDAEMVQDFEADWAELQAAAGADTSAATAEWVEGQKLHPTASVRRSVGQQVKVKSTSGQWRDTTIVESKDGRVRVHYDGFDSKYDEWLKTDSERVDWGRVTGDAEEAKLRDEALASLSVLDSAAAEGGAKGGEEGEEGEPERPPLTASEQARENWVAEQHARTGVTRAMVFGLPKESAESEKERNDMMDMEHLFSVAEPATAAKALYEHTKPDEFDEALERFKTHKNAQIQQVCQQYYQDFMHSASEMEHVSGELSSLKSEIKSETGPTGEKMREMLGKKHRALELRAIRHNVSVTVAELHRCQRVLSICEVATKQMSEKEYFPALKSLETLADSLLPPLAAHPFVQEIQERIPAARRHIQIDILMEFDSWLDTLDESAHPIGEHGLAYMRSFCEQSEKVKTMKKQTLGFRLTVDGDGGATRETLMAKAASIAQQAMIDSSADGRGRGMSVAGAMAGGESATDAMESDHRSVFQVVKLDFAALYKCLHVYSFLGKEEELRAHYSMRRKAGLQAALTLRSPKNEFAGPDQMSTEELTTAVGLLCEKLAGFFIAEQHVARTAPEMCMAGEMEILWKSALADVCNVLQQTVERQAKRGAGALFEIKQKISLFAELMQSQGLYVTDLYELMESSRDLYERALIKSSAAKLRTALSETSDTGYQAMYIQTPEEFDAQIRPHADIILQSSEAVDAWRAGERETADLLPLALPFSACVPAIVGVAKGLVSDYYDYAKEWSEFSSRLTQLQGTLLGVELPRELGEAMPMGSLTVHQAVQIAADLTQLADACKGIELFTAEKLGAMDERVAVETQDMEATLQKQVGRLRECRVEHEDQVMQLMDNKIDGFIEVMLDPLIWASRDGNENQISDSISEAVMYLQTTFSLIGDALPKELLKKVYFAAVTHCNGKLVGVFKGAAVKRVSGAAVESLAEGVAQLRGWAESVPGSGAELSSRLDEVEQICVFASKVSRTLNEHGKGAEHEFAELDGFGAMDKKTLEDVFGKICAGESEAEIEEEAITQVVEAGGAAKGMAAMRKMAAASKKAAAASKKAAQMSMDVKGGVKLVQRKEAERRLLKKLRELTDTM